jgi:hypothetical protein
MRSLVTSTLFALVLSSAPASAQVATSSASGAVVESVSEDPFGDVFTRPEAAPTPEAAAPSAEAQMEADLRQGAAAAAQPASAAPPVPTATALVPEGAVSGQGLYLGPYLRLSGLVVRDPSFGLVSHIGALVRLEGGLELAPFGGNRGLSFEAGLAAGLQSAGSFDTVDAQLGLTSLQVAALYRVPFFTYLAGYVKVGGALNAAHLRLARGLFEKEVDQVKVTPSGSAVAGAELTIPLGYTPMGGGARKANNWLGFFLEVGYEVYGTVDFDGARRDVDEDTDPARIRVLSQSLGDLSLSGWTWRLGGSFRF